MYLSIAAQVQAQKQGMGQGGQPGSTGELQMLQEKLKAYGMEDMVTKQIKLPSQIMNLLINTISKMNLFFFWK